MWWSRFRGFTRTDNFGVLSLLTMLIVCFLSITERRKEKTAEHHARGIAFFGRYCPHIQPKHHAQIDTTAARVLRAGWCVSTAYYVALTSRDTSDKSTQNRLETQRQKQASLS
jgi:hypothetical protein